MSVAKGIVRGIGNSGGAGGVAPVPPSPWPPQPPAPPPPPPAPPEPPAPAAIVEISDAGRAALATAQPPTPPTPGGKMLREMTTGADWDYRLYGPGAAHWGQARATASSGSTETTSPSRELTETTTGSDQFQTTSPGHKHVGEILLNLARDTAGATRQAVRSAVEDFEKDGRPDVSGGNPPAPDIQALQKARHDAAMAAIQNTR